MAFGEEAAFECLVSRHQVRVRNFLARLTNDYALAQDLAQDTFLRAWTRLHTFRGSGSFSAWLMTMAYRLFLTTGKKGGRYREVLSSLHEQHKTLQPITVTNQPGSNSMDLANGWTDLPKLLSILTPEQRAVFVLSYAQGYSHSEISGILSLPTGTVKSHLSRGKKEIQKQFNLIPGGAV